MEDPSPPPSGSGSDGASGSGSSPPGKGGQQVVKPTQIFDLGSSDTIIAAMSLVLLLLNLMRVAMTPSCTC